MIAALIAAAVTLVAAIAVIALFAVGFIKQRKAKAQLAVASDAKASEAVAQA